MNNSSDIASIFERNMKGTADEVEKSHLYAWMEDPQNREEAVQLLQAAFSQSKGSLKLSDSNLEGMFQAIINSSKETFQTTEEEPAATNTTVIIAGSRQRFLSVAVIRWAAAVIVAIAGVALIWRAGRHEHVITGSLKHEVEDVLAGKSGAILTLSDGSAIVLDSMRDGNIASQHGAKVVVRNGQLVYDAMVADTGSLAYNTMSTPRGMQFSMVLPDGTRVWLNAASKLTFPTQFKRAARRVMVQGEAYFEVAGRAEQPFFVSVNGGSEIQVLGTAFNVNAYSDASAVSTTLVNGRIRIMPDSTSVTGTVLHPGQQALLRNDNKNFGQLMTVQAADIHKVLAWKNGVFDFNGAKLEEVMKQLSRWYNIEVVYENGIPEKEFVGKMSRELSLAAVLRGLEDAEVHFRIEEGRRLVVLK